MWQLIINGPGYFDTAYELPEGVTHMGRADENDIVLSGDLVSRKHARITVKGDELQAEDLGSRNGSKVNGTPLVGTKPLKDLNLIQPKIDPAIQRIMAAPYSLQGLKTCNQYRTAVAGLTVVLGPDVDAAENQHKDKSPAEQALSLGESAAGSLIPFSGVIRRLSGAEAKQNYAKAAIFAGSLRRAYLKGTARAKGCKL